MARVSWRIPPGLTYTSGCTASPSRFNWPARDAALLRGRDPGGDRKTDAWMRAVVIGYFGVLHTVVAISGHRAAWQAGQLGRELRGVGVAGRYIGSTQKHRTAAGP